MRAIVVVAVSAPEVPVMVTVDAPVVAVLLAVRVSTLVPVVELGLNEAVTPLGNPEAVRATFPLKPFTSVTVMVSVALEPWVTESVDAEGASVKPIAGMVRVRVAELTSVPSVPVSKTL